LVVKDQDHLDSHFLDMHGIKYRLPDSSRDVTGQADRIRRALVDSRDHFDSPAVRFGDFASHVKAHADAGRAVAFRPFGAGASN
jgi:hypothetical protein